MSDTATTSSIGTQTLYASFTDASLAEKAGGALLDYGAQATDITIVAHDSYHARRGAVGATEGAVGGTASAVGAGVHNAGDRIAQAGDRVGAATASAVGAHGTAANMDAAADQHAANADTRSSLGATRVDNTGTAYNASAGDAGGSTNDTDAAAKGGISTTTPADAGVGAAGGAGIGLGLGVLGALASLLVPGVGLVIGSGALATAIAGAVGTTAAGAIAGGALGYLKDMGVPGNVAQDYHKAVENGGAILAVHLPSGNLDAASAQELLNKYGAANVSYGNPGA